MIDHELQIKAVALRCGSKSLEFDGFGSYPEFAIIEELGRRSAPVLIPSNSMGLEFQAVATPRN
jgi:hypothetical protein